MNEEDAPSKLFEFAKQLRPVKSDPRVSVLTIAEQLGIKVSIETSQHGPSLGGRFIPGPPPIVHIYRRASTAASRPLNNDDERLLSNHERFSVAHEVGHWVLARQLDAPKSTGRSAYWHEEELVNAFAGRLLVPEWLVSRWLKQRIGSTIISPFEVANWARNMAVSEAVVVTELCRNTPSIGFMRLTKIKRKQDKRIALRIDHVSAGDGLQLPNLWKHILNERLLNTLKSKYAGTKLLRGCTLDEKHIQNLMIAWREIRSVARLNDARGELIPDGGAQGYWVSLAKMDKTSAKEGSLL